MFPAFSAFAKDAIDLVEEDFPTQISLAVKTTAPRKIGVTTSTTLNKATGGLVPALAVSWARDSFTLEKLELENDGRINLETSVTDAYQGLDINYKGNSIDKSDLNMTYKYVLDYILP
jgi:hypothetical protein